MDRAEIFGGFVRCRKAAWKSSGSGLIPCAAPWLGMRSTCAALSKSATTVCASAGIAASTPVPPAITRYRMNREEIISSAGEAARFGYGSVVMQSGEDPGLTRDFVSELSSRNKGDNGTGHYAFLGRTQRRRAQGWKEAGADRYLLRFETSDPVLYDRIHPSLPGKIIQPVRPTRADARYGV